ncbi:putative ribonuclease H-like domain-containing protein, partial [Tanacetum coccineum]
TKACNDASKARMETLSGKDYILLPMWPADPLFSQDLKSSPDAGFKSSGEEEKKDAKDLKNESGNPTEGKDSEVPKVNAVDPKTSIELPNDPNMPELEGIVYSDDDEDVGAEVEINNLDAFMPISPIPITRVHKDHPFEQIVGDLNSAPQTRRMIKNLEEHGVSTASTKLVLRVYKVEKALYGLHQAPRAWYETLSTYLLDNGFQRGKIDKTLFIRRVKSDILLVQVYVDGIILGSTKNSLCIEFEKMMHKKFQISSMSELTFFLGLQVKQNEDGFFQSRHGSSLDMKSTTGVDKNKVIITESTIRSDLQLEDAKGVDFLPNAVIFEQLTLIGKSKEKNTKVPQPSGSTDNVPDENVPTTSNDPLLSGEDRLKLTELMDLCTNLQKKVLDLEKAKTAQDSEIASLKKKVKKLERRNKSRTLGLKRLRKVGSARRVESYDEASLGDQEDASKQGWKIADINADAEVTLIDETQGRNDDNLMFNTGVLDEQEVEVEKVVSTAEVTTKTELEEEERLTRQKEEEANISLIESWDNTQAMMDADYQMAQQLQAEEQEQLSIKEKSKLFVQLLEARMLP